MKVPKFPSKRISKTRTITLNGSLKNVFPLFGPIKEMNWAYGWNPEIVYSETNAVEEHMVFTTKTHHGHGETNYTWIVSNYEPKKSFMGYTVFTTERLWTIAIQCSEETHTQRTRAEITYTYTGLTDTGHLLNQRDLDMIFCRDLEDWEEAINHYLSTGEKLRRDT